jgi:hypothetical protein
MASFNHNAFLKPSTNPNISQNPTLQGLPRYLSPRSEDAEASDTSASFIHSSHGPQGSKLRHNRFQLSVDLGPKTVMGEHGPECGVLVTVEKDIT